MKIHAQFKWPFLVQSYWPFTTVAIIKQKLRLDHSLYTILQILSITLFEKKPILQVFYEHKYTFTDEPACKRLILYDL